MNILRVGLMCRVSTEEQALHGDSMQAQEETLVQYAQSNDMKIYKIYRDAGFSARKPVLKRPAMLELLEDVKAGKIDMVLFTKLDRWFRNVKEYHKIQEILERNKVVWKAILEDYSTATADGRLKVNIMLSVAENEADRTGERIKFVFNSKIMRRETIFNYTNTPYGYIVAEIDGVKRLIKNEETREIVEFFFKNALLYTIRYSAMLTTQKFNLDRNWTTWYKMCKNEIYTGTYKGVDNYCEPYLTQAQFEELGAHKPIRKAQKNRIYLFAGMIVCPHCGTKMTSKHTVTNNKDKFTYRCPNTQLNQCTVRSIAETRVERYILENIKDELEKFILSHEVSASKKKTNKTDTAKYKEQLRRLNVAYQAGNIEDDEYLSKAKEIKALIEKSAKADSAENKVDTEALKEFLHSGFEKIYDSLTKEEQQRLWRSVISDLKYDGHNIVGITFKT